ncbi:thioesterase family protein [Mumia sp. DW29H23]|uniref:thioesterase family protein n=1 Tax=Mumia sp. DW29H23 TaxID=3421241 RepID=UPI003D696DD5
MSSPSAFDRDTASRPASDPPSESPSRTRLATLTDRWHTPNATPNGGYVLATMLRAVGADAAYPDPLVAAATYFKPAVVGEATITTDQLRRGRRIATYASTLAQSGGPVTHLVASFTDRAATEGPSVELGRAPDLPRPEACPPFTPAPAFASATVAERVEYRFVDPPAWAGGLPSGDPIGEYWVRFTDGRPIDLYALAFLVDAYPPAVAELAEASDVTVQLTIHFHRVPTSEWVAGRVSTRHLVDGYHEEDMELWDASGNLVAQSRQLVLVT